MKRTWVSVIVAVAFLAVAVSGYAADRKRAVLSGTAQSAMTRLTSIYSPAQLEKGVYVGSNFCLACHTTMSTYKDTNHASFLRRPLVQYSLVPGKGVIADSDLNGVDDFIQGLDFNKIDNATFNKYKPNAPVLSVENGTYFVTIGSLKMPVVFTAAGQRNGSDQRYVVRVPVTDTTSKLTESAYFAPISYSAKTNTWAGNSPGAWYDSTNAPKFSAGIGSASVTASGGPSNHTANCVACHSTGINGLSKTSTGEVTAKLYTAILFTPDDPTVFDYNNDGQFELMNIGCEDCHGPGSLHILGSGDPSKIVNPKNLKPAAQSEICGRCHVTAKSVPSGLYSYPYNEATNSFWTPVDGLNGTPLNSFYQFMKGAPNLWPDGVTPNGGRPYNQYILSNHATFAAHTVGCPDCHDPHNEGEGMLIREETVSGTLTMKTSAEDNSLCISCHATHGPFADFTKQDLVDAQGGKLDAQVKIANTVSKHTNHPYAPTRIMGLSNCTGCHMSMGHTFQAISPDATVKYADQGGMANSCSTGCHNSKVDIFSLGVKGTQTGNANAFDLNLAKKLQKYYGEGGIWWDTKK